MWSNFKFHLQLVKIHVSTIALGKDVAMSVNIEYTHKPMTQQFHLTVYLTEMCTCVFSNVCTGMFIVLFRTENNLNVLQCCWSLIKSVTAQHCREINLLVASLSQCGAAGASRQYPSLLVSPPSGNSGKHYVPRVNNTPLDWLFLNCLTPPTSPLLSPGTILLYPSGPQTSPVQYYPICIELKNRENLPMVTEVE